MFDSINHYLTHIIINFTPMGFWGFGVLGLLWNDVDHSLPLYYIYTTVQVLTEACTFFFAAPAGYRIYKTTQAPTGIRYPCWMCYSVYEIASMRIYIPSLTCQLAYLQYHTCSDERPNLSLNVSASVFTKLFRCWWGIRTLLLSMSASMFTKLYKDSGDLNPPGECVS